MKKPFISSASRETIQLEFPLIVQFVESMDLEAFNHRISRLVADIEMSRASQVSRDETRIETVLSGLHAAVKILQEMIDLKQFIHSASENETQKE